VNDSIKGLFFDLDGTLVDTLDANIHAYQKALHQINREVTQQELAQVFGMRHDIFLKQIYDDITREEILEISRLKSLYYPEFLHLCRPHLELISFVRTLRSEHTTVLVTMAQRKNAEAVLKKSSIEDMFDIIITGEDVTKAKPHPESYLMALELSGLDPHEALAFEDSESGLAAAKAAGVPTLKITIPREISN
jgi:HAD superfamily hydrolase (TIGR01509 family)